MCRRSAIAAASGGLILSMAVPAAAAPAENPAGRLPSLDVAALTAEARAALAVAPGVTVPTAATWTFDAPAIAVVANPKPEPEPEPVVQRRASASRSSDRAAGNAGGRTAKAETTRAETAKAETTKAAARQVQAQAETAPAPAPAPEPAPAPPPAAGGSIIDIAAQFVGVPYVSGGSTPSGFDCSGFTSYVFAKAGISLPRTSGAQRNAGVVVSRADARPGDLIFSPGHIGIYAGGNTQIDAPRPGKTIQFRDIWQKNPTFVRVTG